jgi:hypothetical protein
MVKEILYKISAAWSGNLVLDATMYYLERARKHDIRWTPAQRISVKQKTAPGGPSLVKQITQHRYSTDVEDTTPLLLIHASYIHLSCRYDLNLIPYPFRSATSALFPRVTPQDTEACMHMHVFFSVSRYIHQPSCT